jgi:KaiC/GvpD/RAD55 family RecA-like ATPase
VEAAAHQALAPSTATLITIARREARRCWTLDTRSVAVIDTSPIGFAGAAEDDRQKWLNGFRRLIDGLDAPLQVVIRVQPGPDADLEPLCALPSDPAEMRGADLAFAHAISRSASAHRVTTSLVTARSHANRLQATLTDMGIAHTTTDEAPPTLFGREAANRFLHAGGVSRTWYVERLPGTHLDPGWLFRLLPPGLAITLAWHATPLPAAWIVAYLQRQLVHMRANRLLDANAGASDPALAGALPNAEDLQRRLASSQDKAFHVALYVTLTSPAPEAILLGSQRVEAAARAILCDLQPCTFRMLDGFLATQPGGPDRLHRKRVVDSSSLVTFFPWHEPDLQQAGGLFTGRNRATGAPVLLEPFDQRRYANANIGVFGHSGAGKTYLLSTLAIGALGKGVQLFIVDPEHEYGGLAEQLGGVDVQLALGSGHALNVLDLRPADRRSEEEWLGPAAADVVDLCACVCGGLDEAERALVEGAARQAYDDTSEPVLRDVADRLPRGSRTALILHRWVTGSLGKMFSAPTNVDLEAPIVAFGMRELRDEMVAPVHFLLAEALWTRIKRKDRRRMLVIDELGLLFEDPTIRRFVVSLARRIRKYDGSLVFATQNPGDLLSSDQGAVVATNPALVFFGAQRPSEAGRLQQAFHLSPQQRGFLEAGHRGDFLLAAGADRLALEVKAPAWQEEMMRRARSGARGP